MALTAGPLASALVTRRTLGWEPAHPGLIADFDRGDYLTTSSPHN
jgi:hypothetical protein